MSDCNDKYVCTKCRRALRFSLLRCIGCVLIGGHDYHTLKVQVVDHYHGLDRFTSGCKHCGYVHISEAYTV